MGLVQYSDSEDEDVLDKSGIVDAELNPPAKRYVQDHLLLALTAVGRSYRLSRRVIP